MKAKVILAAVLAAAFLGSSASAASASGYEVKVGALTFRTGNCQPNAVEQCFTMPGLAPNSWRGELRGEGGGFTYEPVKGAGVKVTEGGVWTIVLERESVRCTTYPLGLTLVNGVGHTLMPPFKPCVEENPFRMKWHEYLNKNEELPEQLGADRELSVAPW